MSPQKERENRKPASMTRKPTCAQASTDSVSQI
jgi:hypothetical protein